MDDRLDRNGRRGVIGWFVRNPVAANLLMVMLLLGGFVSMWGMRMEVFPEFDTGLIIVRVPYLGATPAEVEQGVVLRVEEAVAGIEGIDRLTSTSSEGLGTVIAHLEDYADTRRVLSDIEAAVDRIDTFPAETERPIISEVTPRARVLSVVLHGDVPERTLKALAEQLRDELTALPNITQVELSGVRPFELAVEVSEQTLRRHGLTFEEVAEAVRRASVDLPGGSVRTPGGEVLLRTPGQRYVGREFEGIELLTRADGTTLYLGDIAEVRDDFEETDTVSYFDGERAATVNVFRIGDQDAIEIAETVHAHAEEFAERLPAGVTLDTWADDSSFLQSRIDLLTRNAMLGLLLVFLALTLFLDLRLAFWTTLGIPISFLGAFWLLPMFGVTINMLSLFALIIVLGIVVDDAIVVGENIFAARQRGLGPIAAAVRGAREMSGPVVIAILTTVVAFLPMLFTAGEMGKILREVPIVVITVLLLSLVEALLILPAHLAVSARRGPPGIIARAQRRIRAGLEWVIHGPYVRALRWAVRRRYATAAIAVAVFAITVGYVAGGHIQFVFFSGVDAEHVVASLTMPQGTPVEQTGAAVRRVEAAAERVRAKLRADRADGRDPFEHVSVTVGRHPFREVMGGPAAVSTAPPGGKSHLAEVIVELLPSEFRDTPSAEVANLWREEIGSIAGASSLTFISSYFSAGEAINVELAHGDFDTLLAAAERFKQVLGEYVGVSDIEDSFLPGKRELRLALRPEGRNLGLTLMDLGRQVRQGFYGEEAQRVQRGREDIRVMVRYPRAERRSLADIDSMRIRLPDGAEVPFHTVAEVTEGRGYAAIHRADRRRVVSVTADVDESVANANVINERLAAEVLPDLTRRFPGLLWRFEGERKQQEESMRSLAINFMIALVGIFALLGVQFRSYVQPLIIMSAIPFGLIGAVIGHVIMGLDLSFISGFGIVALTGVVVNDSLIMIDLINRERRAGVPLRRVIYDCGTRRFRPILLTTLTTFCGLTPMLLETSLQARFLVPMAVSLAFGVLFATLITLILVPTLYMILEDARHAAARWARRTFPAEAVAPAAE